MDNNALILSYCILALASLLRNWDIEDFYCICSSYFKILVWIYVCDL
jgi:hypothetical protein